MSGMLQPDQTISIQLAAQHWENICRALARQPYFEVVHLIGEIQRQCQMHEMRQRAQARADTGSLVQMHPQPRSIAPEDYAQLDPQRVS